MNNFSFFTRHASTAAAGATLAFALVLAGCASTPAPTLLTLPAAVPAAPAPGATASSTAPGLLPVLALARVDAPEYIVSRRVRYRTDGATLAEWPDTYWAERIEISLSREFVAAMRERLPGWRVCDANCGELSPALGVRVVLNRMDYLRGERMLKASVRVIVSTSERLPRTLQDQERSYEIAASGDSAQAQARTYADLLARVAADASALLPPAGTATAPRP